MGIKKELMFFSRSFRLAGVIIASVVFALISPLLMKFSYSMISGLMETESGQEISEAFDEDNLSISSSSGMSFGLVGDMLGDEELMAKMGVISSVGDLTNTLMLIFMLVTMYSAGGELKKRSMIIPQNAGLTPKLYILPKFLVFPLIGGILAFVGVWLSFGMTALMFGAAAVGLSDLALTALLAAVFNAFMITLYFTLGICTKKAGVSVVIMYGGNAILTTLFQALGASKFHPFALIPQCQELIAAGEADLANIWGSIGVTLLLMALCYFVTLFVVSAKKIDNRGVEEMEL
ncbi:MAG: hypothetical protein NC203_11840 [Firmicutes bacterium]|nr:hypothetical protein [[Eubacterium] siraeum]MCM1489044.1 hypothetical protein [Bacillota bacterium]